MHVADQFIGIEVLVSIEDLADEHAPGLGQLLATDLEELPKFRFGGLGDGKRCQFDRLCGCRPREQSPDQTIVVLAAECRCQAAIKNGSSF